MQIALSDKFACYAFTQCWLADGVPREIELRPGLWAATSLDFDVAEHWQTWLGSITVGELREANLILYTTMASSRPDQLDAENAILKKNLTYVLYGLLLQGIPVYERLYLLTGAHVRGGLNVREFFQLEPYRPTAGLADFRPGIDELRRAEVLSTRLQRVNEGGAHCWARLRRGVTALLQGSRMDDRRMDDRTERLHQFVRALEALIKPDIRKTKRQFVDRISQTFTVASAETRATLEQIYELRNRIEHLHDPLDVLPGDRGSRIAAANRRTRQVDALARVALTRVLENERLLEMFKTDEGIKAFWALPDDDRAAAWGARLDVTRIK